MMKSKIKLSRYAIVTVAVWAVSVVVLGGGYLMFYAPQKVQLCQVTNQCDESQTSLHEAKMAAEDNAKVQQKRQCEEVDRLISTFSMPQDAVTEMVFEIGRIANDLRLSEFSSKNQKQNNYGTVGKSKLVSEVWLNVDFQATFEQFAQFLNRLESNTPVVFVEEISFRRRDTQEHDVSLQLSFLTETGANTKNVAMATD